MIPNLFTEQETINMLAQRAKSARIACNLTQRDLALKAGVSLSCVKRFEQSGAISLSKFIAIVFALGMSSTLDTVLLQQLAPQSIQELIAPPKALPQRVRKGSKD